MKQVLLSLAIVAYASTNLFAWGGEGHQVVSLIAEDRLTPQAQNGIHDLLGKDVDISDAEIASWADQIKRERPNTRSWHYIDIPVTADSFDRARDAKKPDNLIDKTTEYINILSDKSKSKEVRAEALKFIVHFVGDLHQPLHCAERDNDAGGNKVPVVFLDKKTPSNLHTVWDTDLIRQYVGKTKIAAFSTGLTKQIKASDAKKWQVGGIVEWANETHKIAVDDVYKDVPVAGTAYDAKTVETKRKIIEQQLERGGVRLAAVLNEAFKK